MDEVSKAKAELKYAKQEQLSLDLWQQAIQAGRQPGADEPAQREANARQAGTERER